LNLGLSSQIETAIRARLARGVTLTDFEKKFIECPVSYDERVASLTEFVRSIKDPKNIDIENIKYKNPAVGDCIIPYPDVSQKGKVVPYAFETNKIRAQAVSQTGAFSLPPEIRLLLEKEQTLSAEFMQSLESLEKQRSLSTASG
jgi:hypothetical protein